MTPAWHEAPIHRVILGAEGGTRVTLKDRILFVVLLLMTTSSALAQSRGGAITIRFGAISPVIALLAGILILIIPRLLNYIVATYLILVGLIGLLGR
jgi:Protein of unknown function (DUF3096)